MKNHKNKTHFRILFSCVTIIVLVGAGCCISNSGQPVANENASEICGPGNLTPSDIFTAPYGGFNQTLLLSVRPNSSTSTGYLFSSRNYQGNVTLKTGATGNFSVSIEPSTFLAVPDHTYISNISITAGPDPFESGSLAITVSLENATRHYGNDTMEIYSTIPPGLIWVNQDDVVRDSDTIVLKKGDCQRINLTYKRGLAPGMGEIRYSVSETPLNVTVVPSQFVAKHLLDSTSGMYIFAPHSLSPGKYSINLTVTGASQILEVDKGQGRYDFMRLENAEKVIPFEISVQ